jgi:hypothetical protein
MPRPGNRRYDTDRAWTGKRLRDEVVAGGGEAGERANADP